MRLIVDGETYIARFMHTTAVMDGTSARKTTCKLERDKVVLGEGSILCATSRFQKRASRIDSLGLALRSAELGKSRETRRRMWQAYFAISKPPRTR